MTWPDTLRAAERPSVLAEAVVGRSLVASPQVGLGQQRNRTGQLGQFGRKAHGGPPGLLHVAFFMVGAPCRSVLDHCVLFLVYCRPYS